MFSEHCTLYRCTVGEKGGRFLGGGIILGSPLSCPDLFLYTITLPAVGCDAPPTLSYTTLELARVSCQILGLWPQIGRIQLAQNRMPTSLGWPHDSSSLVYILFTDMNYAWFPPGILHQTALCCKRTLPTRGMTMSEPFYILIRSLFKGSVSWDF